jgi:hypothetical protein
MSVPTHNLYDFVHRLTKNRFYLRHFYPYSSRYLKDCQHLCVDGWTQGPNNVSTYNRFDHSFDPKYKLTDSSFITFQPVLFCHDQEPLLFDYYADQIPHMKDFCQPIKDMLGIAAHDFNLRWIDPLNLQKTWILLHSELNSTELKKYESTGSFVGAYWWSHAMLALDWYRFAQHDPSLTVTNQYQKLFLIYCRDTSGLRTYRKTFMSSLEEKNITNDCQIGSFLNYIGTSESSAVYDSVDFNNSGISIVLETVFDSRIHLTEKTLRPLACGHPFMLAAGPGSLELLKHYGFKTFSPYINESYDSIKDDDLRLQAVLSEMKRIQILPTVDLDNLINQCNLIAEFNKKHFFSTEFFNQVVKELQDNVATAFNQHQGELDFSLWWRRRKHRRKNLLVDKNNDLANLIVKLYRQHRLGKLT